MWHGMVPTVRDGNDRLRKGKLRRRPSLLKLKSLLAVLGMDGDSGENVI